MNEAMPRWRTFTSDPPEPSPSDGTGAELEVGTGAWSGVRTGDRSGVEISRLREALPEILAALGGSAAGAALALAAVMLLVPWADTGLEGAFDAALPGRLDGMDTMAADDSAVATAAVAAGAGGAAEIMVDVAGAVMHPGLHRLRSGDRVGDAIDAAGGFGLRVDLVEASRSLNLAAPLDDGGKVLVPELGSNGPGRASEEDGRIDLNTADQSTLESLPGIGPVTAARIVEARAERRFGAVADLLARGVVGQAVFKDIEDLVRASG